MKLRTSPSSIPSPVSPRRPPCPGCATSASPAWSASSLASAWDQVGLGDWGAMGWEWGLQETPGVCRQLTGPEPWCCPMVRPWFMMLYLQVKPHHKPLQPHTSPGYTESPPGSCSRRKQSESPGNLSRPLWRCHHSCLSAAGENHPAPEYRLQQPGVKPGLVYPVDVLAELLTDL